MLKRSHTRTHTLRSCRSRLWVVGSVEERKRSQLYEHTFLFVPHTLSIHTHTHTHALSRILKHHPWNGKNYVKNDELTHWHWRPFTVKRQKHMMTIVIVWVDVQVDVHLLNRSVTYSENCRPSIECGVRICSTMSSHKERITVFQC